jgi:hypothetical protein
VEVLATGDAMIFRTKNQGAAACLLYALGPASHRKTFLEGARGATFLFADQDDTCAEIVQRYFSDHGEGGYAVEDAKSLIDCFIQIRRTLTAAIENGGKWENTEL